MENSLIFTGLILLAGLAGGLIGSACGRKRNEPDAEVDGRIADLEDRLDALADHCMDEVKKLKDRAGSLEDKAEDFAERLYDCEMLVGETPEDGLLGRVGELEEARRKEDMLQRVNMLTDEVRTLAGRFDTFEGGASLELAGLRKAVGKLEEKANG